MPQGSVLGPLLYLLYTADICSLLSSQGLLHQLFADDVQGYIHTYSADAVAAVSQMCRKMDVLSLWMASNRLLLNPSKTQFIWFGGRRQLQGIDLSQLALLFPHISFSLTVRDLGLTLDSELTLSQHVNLVARSAYYQLRQLRVVSRSLSHDAVVVLVHAFVTSRIEIVAPYLLVFPLRSWGDLIVYCALLLALLGGFLNLLLSLPICVMCCAGCLCPCGSHTALLLWSLAVSLAVLRHTCVIFAVQSLTLQRVVYYALRLGVNFWSRGPA